MLLIFYNIYKGYPESKFWWAIKKKQEYIINHLYCHLMYTIVDAFVIVGHQFLYPFIMERCRLRCKACNGFFDVVVVELPTSKEGYEMQEQMKITWR